MSKSNFQKLGGETGAGTSEAIKLTNYNEFKKVIAEIQTILTPTGFSLFGSKSVNAEQLESPFYKIGQYKKSYIKDEDIVISKSIVLNAQIAADLISIREKLREQFIKTKNQSLLPFITKTQKMVFDLLPMEQEVKSFLKGTSNTNDKTLFTQAAVKFTNFLTTLRSERIADTYPGMKTLIEVNELISSFMLKGTTSPTIAETVKGGAAPTISGDPLVILAEKVLTAKNTFLRTEDFSVFETAYDEYEKAKSGLGGLGYTPTIEFADKKVLYAASKINTDHPKHPRKQAMQAICNKLSKVPKYPHYKPEEALQEAIAIFSAELDNRSSPDAHKDIALDIFKARAEHLIALEKNKQDEKAKATAEKSTTAQPKPTPTTNDLFDPLHTMPSTATTATFGDAYDLSMFATTPAASTTTTTDAKSANEIQLSDATKKALADVCEKTKNKQSHSSAVNAVEELHGRLDPSTKKAVTQTTKSSNILGLNNHH